MKKIFDHLMIDLEIMGNTSFSAIVSIAAVEWDPATGQIGDEFYERIDFQSCLDEGLHVDGSTVLWWLQQNEEARKEICKGGKHIAKVLDKFSDFCGVRNYHLWGNSARFDLGLLYNAYQKVGLTVPWKHTLEKDVRTLVWLAPEFKYSVKFEGVKHNPVDDCKHQINYCSLAYQKLIK